MNKTAMHKTHILIAGSLAAAALLLTFGVIATKAVRSRAARLPSRTAAERDAGTQASPDEGIPTIAPDVRNEVRRVVDARLAYAERNAALIKIGFELNGNEVSTFEECILDEPCCTKNEIHALKNDMMNALRKRSPDTDSVVLFLCRSADVFLERNDNVMVDYCIQHAAAALEGNLSPSARGLAMELLINATGHTKRTWSATALLSLDRLPQYNMCDKGFLERRTLLLLSESSLDAVRISCIDVAKRNRWKSAVPVLQELQKNRGLSMAMKLAIDSGLDALR